ncbi:MAG TPA: substrate-binding domain-containing protein [Anaerovoracaceae bacterium]|nr:substrate-binding domain-containing protein [Anaerovoracaceae bacterium]
MKKLLLIMFVVVLALSFSACGGGEQAPASEDQAPASEKPAAPDTTAETPAVTGEILSTGPNGEKATPATTLSLTDEEIQKVKDGKYTAAICFHYAGNDWSSAQQKGLQDTFAKLGIEVVSVTDANFKPEQQVSDIETVLALDPDIIVSIPTDPVATAPAYKKAAEDGVKIVFMDNCPAGMKAGVDYVSVVSADNYGNGVKAAEIMADNLGGKGKIGVIYYDADFFVTNQRVEAFEKTIKSDYPDIEIVEKSGFQDPNKVSEVADAMLTKNPNLNGIFAVWDVPAEAVVASAIAAGRDDLVITTIDLGNNVARMIAEGGMIKGLGAQLPYDQGVAEATLAAYSLLGKEAPEYVAVPALAVTNDNVLDAYKTVYHMDPPADIKNAKQ